MIQVPAEQERDAHRAAAAAALPTAGPVVPVYYNRRLPEAQRRQAIYDGALFVFSGLAAIRRLGDWAGELAAKAFQGVPEMLRAHRHLAVEEFVRRVSPLKSRFTNDARTKRLCQELVVEMGADPQRTYFDLPRLRVIPPASYLAAGVSYNYAPHRDTWYAHPRQLVNYWAPLHDTQPSTVMTMFVDHFRRPVANTSARWDYGEWVRNARFNAAASIRREERAHPVPLAEVAGTTQLRLVLNGGDAMVFSTCQLHASTPNDTDAIRFSFDLRTLNLDDLEAGRGPVDVDGQATGTTLPDFLRGSDLAPLQRPPGTG